MTKIQKLLVGAAAMAAVLLTPGAALAVTTATVSGTTVTVWSTCTSATTFAVTGAGKSYNVVSSGMHNGGASASFTEATAGTFKVISACDGNSATFTIAPKGAPASGDGGLADNSLQLIGGTVLVGAAAGGLVLMRRRARATSHG